MGNGHPIAAVVTRAEIVDRFAAATTYFSTFGGNPVACAAALAVLEVIADERLIERAAETGGWLRSTIAALGDRHMAIGDVRGRGLMIGIELVGDRTSRLPARKLATRVKDEMRERGVLIGTTGRDGNVLKIRPPLCIGLEEASTIASTLDEALRTVSG
jgi:4-aminobutyrate aminotransferase-like enzyme